MKSRLPRIYYLIPAVYVAVIAVFLLLQFQARRDFEHQVGNLLLRGSYTRTLRGGERVRRVEARFHGVGLQFTSRGILAEGSRQLGDQNLSVQSFERFQDGAGIGFQRGVTLRLTLQEGGERVDARLSVPAGLESVRSLSVPFSVFGPARPRPVPGLPLLAMESPGGAVYLALPQGSEIDLDGKRLLLHPAAAGADPAPLDLTIERTPGAPRPYLYWFSMDVPLAGPGEYQAAVGRYVDKAYGYWSRVLAGNPASPELGGALGAALVSEELHRGDYRRTLGVLAANLRPVLARSPGSVGLRRSAVYFGDLPGYLALREAEAKEQIEEITRALRGADPAVFETPDLLASILDHGPLALVEEALRLADTLERQGVSVRRRVCLLEFYLEALRLLPAPGGAAQRIAQIVDNELFPAIRRSSNGPMLNDSLPAGRDGESDLLCSIRAGRALLQAGELLRSEAYASAGRGLVLAALRWSDAEGFLPARLSFFGSEAQPVPAAGETLAPELIYPLVAAEPYIPREYPLYRWLGPGTWLFTAARLGEVKVDQGQQRFFFRFPQGSAHYLLIRGVEPALSVLMHGISWKSDPEYYRYSDGWAYDPDSQTLFMKITHRGEQEEIVLSY